MEDDVKNALNLDRWNLLSNELKVATEIHLMNAAREVPYFNSVAANLAEKGLKKTTVHSAINCLIDQGTIDAEWEKVGSSWVRRFYISGESKGFIRTLVDSLYE